MVSKEETDKIYFKKGFDLEKTHCVVCDIFFSDEPAKEEVCYVPSTTQPTYLCLGQTTFNCEHGYCIGCYIKASESHCGG